MLTFFSLIPQTDKLISLEILELLITILTTGLASSGFWLYLASRKENKDAQSQLLRGLAQDRILFLGMRYIERGYITQDEYENLHEGLYTPYKNMGGNGCAKRVMEDVEKLPIYKNARANEKELAG